MSIIRVDPAAGNWTIVSNSMANDDRLTLEARGLMLFLLSKPPSWIVRATALPMLLKEQASKSGHVGRQRVRRMLKELERAGYLLRNRSKTRGGQWCLESIIYGTSITIDQKPVVGEPVDRNPSHRKPVDKTKTKQVKTEYKKTNDEIVEEAIATVFECRKSLPPPFDWEDEQIDSCISECPHELRQQVLNEVEWIFSRGKLRGSPYGLLRALSLRAKHGRFSPSKGAASLAEGVATVSQIQSHRRFVPANRQSEESKSNARKIIDALKESLKEAPSENSKKQT